MCLNSLCDCTVKLHVVIRGHNDTVFSSVAFVSKLLVQVFRLPMYYLSHFSYVDIMSRCDWLVFFI